MKPNDLPMTAVIKRDGNIATYDRDKIRNAILKAYLFDECGEKRLGADGDATRTKVDKLTLRVEESLSRHGTSTIPIETIQDMVELELMRTGEHDVARGYVLFRNARNQVRAASKIQSDSVLTVKLADGSTTALDPVELKARIALACADRVEAKYVDRILADVLRNLYNGAPVV